MVSLLHVMPMIGIKEQSKGFLLFRMVSYHVQAVYYTATRRPFGVIWSLVEEELFGYL